LKKLANFGLLAAVLVLTSCGGSDTTQQEEGKSGGAQESGNMQGMDHGGMTGMNHGSMDQGSMEGMQDMSMETVDPETAGVSVGLTTEPTSPQPGQAVTLSYRLTDIHSGQVLTDLPIDHERPMHLIYMSRDLMQFQHIHPEVTAGEAYSVTTEFPEPGTYILYDEFVLDGQSVLDRRELFVSEPSTTSASLAPDLAPKMDGDLTVTLEAPEEIRPGEAASFVFTVTHGERVVTNLEPYLGAAAHVAIVSEDTEDFAHVHGEAGEDGAEAHEGMGSMDNSPPATFGPEVGFHHTFPRVGLYKVWGQFSYSGRVITVPFVVEVA
jgi:Cu+-exporting ATPase